MFTCRCPTVRSRRNWPFCCCRTDWTESRSRACPVGDTSSRYQPTCWTGVPSRPTPPTPGRFNGRTLKRPITRPVSTAPSHPERRRPTNFPGFCLSRLFLAGLESVGDRIERHPGRTLKVPVSRAIEPQLIFRARSECDGEHASFAIIGPVRPLSVRDLGVFRTATSPGETLSHRDAEADA